ncbi:MULTISPECIES: maleylpyruvate isomerase family mycothiol-dependent enzyme [Streptomyces]|uniref:Mycothiol maleylpyruvate isomerase n=2 Tax=Streptomyces TaxID=1883 RepID=A0A2N8PL97_STRNR|nr:MULTISPECIES: maleylpyruvate isomerase family mycothiol-dependent enzyme [Streptomyces]PNE41806.1 mycothiol maleylpyruvate isomerase [Streptomyces noursei]SHL93412.1 maleylpyruvate isomerase [Streptomyces yunnanensis]
MTIPPDFARDVAAVHDSTDRLLVSLGKLDDAAVGEPSLLPGWTRGHVLAHLARNADALVNLLNWARTGVPTPMYASAAARDEDIERGADRPLKVHLEDLGESAARFDAAARALPENRRAYEVEMRNGVVERADRLALRRLTEVELHHVDLGVGYTVEQLPDDFVDSELDFLTGIKFARHPGLTALELHADDGRRWRTGGRGSTDGASAGPVVVSGSARDLVGWLTGRADGGLLDTHGAPLPIIPPL